MRGTAGSSDRRIFFDFDNRSVITSVHPMRARTNSIDNSLFVNNDLAAAGNKTIPVNNIAAAYCGGVVALSSDIGVFSDINRRIGMDTMNSKRSIPSCPDSCTVTNSYISRCF